MNYEEALSYIHGICWRGSRLGLSRTYELLALLDNPQNRLRFVHIAGTNGKGSTASMLASILNASGYRVGLYTSPFINRFNERMQVNGQSIPDELLADLTTEIRPLAETMADPPTEFELITAIAMVYFQREACDIVVLEVGMGGSLDSTNVIASPEVSVLTAIGLDHVRELGPTMADIAAAKAGIIKANRPVVSYGGNPDADEVFAAVCERLASPLHQPDFSRIICHSVTLKEQIFSYKAWQKLSLPLVGSYQLKNAAVVLETVSVLRDIGWHISDDAVRLGLACTHWPARFEVLHQNPTVIVDGGHNPHGIRATAESLERLFPHRPITFVTGVMADKDVAAILGLIVPLAKEFFTVTAPNPRAMTAEALAEKLTALGAAATPCPSPEEGIAAAMTAAGADGIVCALGSLYMSGDIRRYLLAHNERRTGEQHGDF